jgi:hypothetical protein
MPFLHEEFCFSVNYLPPAHFGPMFGAIDVSLVMMPSSFAHFEVVCQYGCLELETTIFLLIF